MGEVDRRYPRYALEATLRVEVGGKVAATGVTKDLSRGGLCASIDQALDLGTESVIELSLRFADDAFSEPIRLPARVVWVTILGETTQIGFQFALLSDEERSYLQMFLRFLEQGREEEEVQEDDDSDDPFAS